MRVTGAMTFDEYWSSVEYRDKRPIRNGSRKMMIGDNIYHRLPENGQWQQADSHHSQHDGTPDSYNVGQDTSTNRVLLSRHFFYFGSEAPVLPEELLSEIGYKNGRSHRTFPSHKCNRLLDWLNKTYGDQRNHVCGDPFQFKRSGARYSGKTNRII